MFPTITSEKQKEFEENCVKNKVGSDWKRMPNTLYMWLLW